MTQETKHSLIVGGGLILAVVLGIIVYKKYEANSQTSQAASDQASQDELAYIESMSMQGAYAGYGGGSALTIPSPPATQSLADQISSLEQAFGFAPAATSGSSSSGSAASSTSSTKPIVSHPVSGGSPAGMPQAEHILAGKYNYLEEEPVAAEGSYVA